MNDLDQSSQRERVFQQFEAAPYPRQPMDSTVKEDAELLFIHSLVTPHYLRQQKVISTEGKMILDAGCGTGKKALALAEANPGATIIGVDISPSSTQIAAEYLQHHGYTNCQFFALDIENLSSLNMQFDYINCDDVLYLMPNIVAGLQAMGSVLKPEGILRANLHSRLQREYYYRAQRAFGLLGLMDQTPGQAEISQVREIWRGLRPEVSIKQRTSFEENYILANYLLINDKGFTVPEMFAALREANLELISMVNWRHWDLNDLFVDANNLPDSITAALLFLSKEEQMTLFELCNATHRLLDFWCGLPTPISPAPPPSEWTEEDWRQARIHLHPQLRLPRVREDLLRCIAVRSPFDLGRYIPLPRKFPVVLESQHAACLLPLWEGAQTLDAMAERWHRIHPVSPESLEPIPIETARKEIAYLLLRLEPFLYVLLAKE